MKKVLLPFLAAFLAVVLISCEKTEEITVNESVALEANVEADGHGLKYTVADIDALPDYVGKRMMEATHNKVTTRILRFVDPIDMPLVTKIGKNKFFTKTLPIQPTFGDPAWIRGVYHDDNNSGIASGSGFPFDELPKNTVKNATAKQIRDALSGLTPYVKFKGHAKKDIVEGDGSGEAFYLGYNPNDVGFRMTTLKGRIYATFDMGDSFEGTNYVVRAVFRRYPEPKNRYFSSTTDKINDVAWFYWSNIDAIGGAKVKVFIKILELDDEGKFIRTEDGKLKIVDSFYLADRGVNWEGVPQPIKDEKNKFRIHKGHDKYVRVRIHMQPKNEPGHPDGHPFWARTVVKAKNLNFRLNCNITGVE